jgi:hypothetical protein
MTFADLPNDARLWVFAAVRRLEPAEVELLLTTVDRHVRGWLAHGHPVVGAHELRYGQFLLVGADERATGVSGCSIDGLFHVLQGLESELAVRLLDSTPVWFRNADGGVRSASRTHFRAQVENGEVGPKTIVFNNTVATVGELREGRWETPLRESWHARAFRIAAAAGSQ